MTLGGSDRLPRFFDLSFTAMSSSTTNGERPSRSDRPLRTKQRIGAAVVLAATLMVPGIGGAIASPPPSPTASPTANVGQGSNVELPRVRAWTWVVADADTGEVLAGRDWKWPLPPASTMKSLTALTLVDRLDLDSEYVVRGEDAEAEGSRVGIEAGSSYKVRDLFNGMLMPSGNDAAAALAGAYGGLDRATAAMNAEAERLGAEQTEAKNTSGLDEPGQTSSAYDLALIMRESLKSPELREMYLQHDVQFPAAQPEDPNEERKSYKIWTENRLVLNYHEGAIAGKTGFTSQAGRTFVGALERDGRTLIVAIMRSAESTEAAVTRILDWTFDNYDELTPVDKLVDPGPEDEVVAQQAVTYGEGGVSNLAQVAPEQVAAAGQASRTPLLIALLLGGVAGLVLWRRRVVAAANTRRRSRSAGTSRDLHNS